MTAESASTAPSEDNPSTEVNAVSTTAPQQPAPRSENSAETHSDAPTGGDAPAGGDAPTGSDSPTEQAQQPASAQPPSTTHAHDPTPAEPPAPIPTEDASGESDNGANPTPASAAGTSSTEEQPNKRKRRRRRKKARQLADGQSTDSVGTEGGSEGTPDGANADQQSASDADTGSASEASHKSNKRKRKRNRKKPHESVDPFDPGGSDALGEAELAAVKQDLEWLVAHRELLPAELSEEETAILSGSEVTRQQLQTLAQRLEATKVLEAAQSLEEEPRTELLQRALQLSSQGQLLLPYLQTQKAPLRPQAAQLANRVLQSCQFDELEADSVSQLLGLCAELFAKEQYPLLMLGLLQNRSFAKAISGAFSKLPGALGEMAEPLRSLNAAIVRGEHRRVDPKLLREGLQLILTTPEGGRELRQTAVRERLLEQALLNIPASDPALSPAIEALLQSLDPTSPKRHQLELLRIGALIHAGDDQGARSRLESLRQHVSISNKAGLWLRALNSPRLGRIAILRRKGGPREEAPEEPSAVPKHRQLQQAFCLDTQRRLWIRVGEPKEEALFDEHLRVHKKALLPNVVQPYTSNLTRKKGPYVAYLAHDSSRSGFRATSALDQEQLLGYALDGVCLLGALANLGIQLPDTHPDRFEVDNQGRLWLLDMWGSKLGTAAEATPPMLALAAAWCTALILDMPYFTLDEDTAAILSQPADFSTLLAGLRRVSQTRYAAVR